ncbi:asparaginase [Aeromicrobium alkaliterrae]|uniref:Asparaginase n=1 Tax=Aeromicrobium alkaliterrae TaxID=302168 RepID=A0ABN2JQL6_9ACTN
MDVLVEVERSGLVESRHRGVLVHVDAAGEVDWALGDPGTVIFPRSANKPLQALAMLEAGLPLDGAELAIATSSHHGEVFQLDVVRAILARAGLDESALQTPASWPDSPHEHARVIREGGGKAPILMDCSGKHAAMLLTCARQGWPIESYLDPEHPLQQQVTEVFTRETGAPPPVVGVDGCGAPLLATTVLGLARAIGRVATGATPETRRLVDAITAHPTHVSGTRSTERHFITGLPGAIAKTAAESTMVVGWPDGSALVGKIEDGGARALTVAMSRAVELLGGPVVLPEPRPAVLGGGRPVGEVRPAF